MQEVLYYLLLLLHTFEKAFETSQWHACLHRNSGTCIVMHVVGTKYVN